MAGLHPQFGVKTEMQAQGCITTKLDYSWEEQPQLLLVGTTVVSKVCKCTGWQAVQASVAH
jgi:hypothetical protein